MKKTFLIILLVEVCFRLNAQSTVEYIYDDSGNRVTRRIIELQKLKDSFGEKDFEIKDEFGFFNVQVFPNPTEGRLILKICGAGEFDTFNLSVFNSMGLLLINKKVIGNGEFDVDLSKYSTGYYILALRGEKESVSYKIIKK